MRALLIVNPTASGTTPRGRDVLTRALGSEFKVDVTETLRRGHAAVLGRQAARDDVDVVVVAGGDGTVNEVVNGLLTDGPSADVPMLGLVPGGQANVFARTLGLPPDPVEATGQLLEAARAGRTRTVGLGRVDDRWFTFTAGFGLDAAAVRAVERHRRHGRPATGGRYLRAAVGEFLRADRRRPTITLDRPGAEPQPGLFLAIVTNTTPWTYLGRRPVVITPDASYTAGLDLFAMRRLGTVATLRVARGMLSGRRPGPRGRAPLVCHDLTEFTLRADRPQGLQVDGDYLGERETARFGAVPEALQVLC